MTCADALALMPLIVLMAGSVAVMIVTAFHRRYAAVASLTIAALALAFGSIALAWRVAPRQVTSLLVLDRYALLYMGLLILATLVVALLSYGYWKHRRGVQEEYYSLLLLATTGACVLVASSHFASFFLGLELLSVSLYALLAYQRESQVGIEAAVKYLVLAGVSSSFLLLGMALVYATYGTMQLSALASTIQAPYNVMALVGLALIIVALGFKLALVPFHLWTPDVYQGAPAPMTAYVATVSKGAIFALLLRYFWSFHIQDCGPLVVAFLSIAVASMLVGNLLALLQENVKRILAYSSISHLGYLLVAFLAGGALAGTAVTFYLVAYFITTLGAFGVVTLLSSHGHEVEELSEYRGLFWRRPVLAGIFTAMLLSLAGIPVTAGFVGKFYVLAAGVGSGLWLAVTVLVVSSAIGLFYYLRIVIALYCSPQQLRIAPPERPAPIAAELPLVGVLALWAMAFLLVLLGIYPAPTLQLIENVVTAALKVSFTL